MPIRPDFRDRTLWLVTEGDVDYEEGLAILLGALAEAERIDGAARWDVVFDIRRSEEERSPDELRQIASFLGEHGRVLSGGCAVIAGDPLHFGLGRMFEAFTEPRGIEVRVVSDEAEAADWLAGRRTPGA